MAERDHAGIADEKIGRHCQQAPDQHFRQESAPEFRQHQWCKDQQRHHHAKSDPVDGVVAQSASDQRRWFVEWRGCHFGVVTNSPVGRNNSVRISTMNDTITACAGLTQIDAYDSSRLMKIAAATEPIRLPMPPTTTTMKALRTQSRPIV